MSFPVRIRTEGNEFVATLLGAPEVRATGRTRDATLIAMRAVLQELVDRGDLVVLELPSEGILALAGKYRDDPTLQEICDEIYRLRDSEPKG